MSVQALLTPHRDKIPKLIKEHYVIILVTLFCGIGITSFLAFSSIGNSEELTKNDRVLLELATLHVQLNKFTEKINSLRGQPQQRGVSRKSKSISSVPYISVKPGKAFQTVAEVKSELYIPSGSVFRAQLLTTLKTSIHEQSVFARTTRTFEMDSRRRIPAGTRVICKGALNFGLKGVVVRCSRIVLPNGREHDGLNLLALSQKTATPLVDGIHFSDAGTNMATALGFGFLSGFSGAAQEREATVLGSVTKSSLKNQVLGGLSVASFQIAEDALKRAQSEAISYVVVPAGTAIYLIFEQKWNIPKGGL